MEEGKDSDINDVVLSNRCKKAYKKLIKKCDPKLKKIINNSIDELKTNSELGEKLTQDLNGMRSIHIEQFKFRIVYAVKEGNPQTMIVVHAIAHRKEVYDELSAYLGQDT